MAKSTYIGRLIVLEFFNVFMESKSSLKTLNYEKTFLVTTKQAILGVFSSRLHTTHHNVLN